MEAFGRPALAKEFSDYGLKLRPEQLGQVEEYLNLLLRWNRRINLTGLREPRRIVRELFCESMYLTRVLAVRGRLLDIGSGAGFPGMALKIAVPELHVVLVEADRRKSVFLKEAASILQMSGVGVRAGRASELMGEPIGKFDIITTRAVRMEKGLLGLAASVLASGGQMASFMTGKLTEKVGEMSAQWQWNAPALIPGTKERIILIGSVAG